MAAFFIYIYLLGFNLLFIVEFSMRKMKIRKSINQQIALYGYRI